MAETTTAYIGLGSNLKHRMGFLKKAIEKLQKIEDTHLVRSTEPVETAPLARPDQPVFLNAVAEVKTALTAEKLHSNLMRIETELGRIRAEKWSSRTIDLDLLLFGRAVINTDDLTVPHPQMHVRCFVLKGLCQLNPELQHPLIKEPVSELFARINGSDFVLSTRRPQLVSIAGVIGAGKTTLAKKLTGLLGCKLFFEPYQENPFLPKVYDGKYELALDSQLYFLAARVEQLTKKNLEDGKIFITDYIFHKELIYAESLLDKIQMKLYKQFYEPAAATVAEPVLVIYLEGTAENCMKRIRQRNRPYEQKIKIEFLRSLCESYHRLFGNWKICPLIRIPAGKYYNRQDKWIQTLASQIKSYTAVADQPKNGQSVNNI